MITKTFESFRGLLQRDPRFLQSFCSLYGKTIWHNYSRGSWWKLATFSTYQRWVRDLSSLL